MLNVSLSLNDADFGATGMQFTLYAAPAYASITPSGGHREGGTLVTVMGAAAWSKCRLRRGRARQARLLT